MSFICTFRWRCYDMNLFLGQCSGWNSYKITAGRPCKFISNWNNNSIYSPGLLKLMCINQLIPKCQVDKLHIGHLHFQANEIRIKLAQQNVETASTKCQIEVDVVNNFQVGIYKILCLIFWIFFSLDAQGTRKGHHLDINCKNAWQKAEGIPIRSSQARHEDVFSDDAWWPIFIL